MADIVSQTVIDRLREIECEDNPLFAYDNYTYNIELCMIPIDKFREYATLKLNYFTNPYGNTPPDIVDFILKGSNKMTIVNTTTTTEMFIDSLSSTTYLGIVNNNSPIQSLNQEFSMKIIENYGCSLTSKLKLAASYYGYKEGYISMPMFLIIHFSGYDTNTLEGVTDIDVVNSEKGLSSNRYLVQEIRITDVSTKIENTRTMYDVKMAANYNMGMALDILSLNGMKPINVQNNTNIKSILEEVVEQIIEYKKDKIKQTFFSNSDYESIYGNDGPLIINITGDIPDFDVSVKGKVEAPKVVEEQEVKEAKEEIEIPKPKYLTQQEKKELMKRYDERINYMQGLLYEKTQLGLDISDYEKSDQIFIIGANKEINALMQTKLYIFKNNVTKEDIENYYHETLKIVKADYTKR